MLAFTFSVSLLPLVSESPNAALASHSLEGWVGAPASVAWPKTFIAPNARDSPRIAILVLISWLGIFALPPELCTTAMHRATCTTPELRRHQETNLTWKRNQPWAGK